MLLQNDDVRALVPQEDFSDDQLIVTMKLVAGWLREATGRSDIDSATELPETDSLWSAALELVALVAENPTSLASRTAGPTTVAWPQARRRDAILARVEMTARAAANGPRGSFPPAQRWPDPAVAPGSCWDPVRRVWTGP